MVTQTDVFSQIKVLVKDKGMTLEDAIRRKLIWLKNKAQSTVK